MIGGRKIHYETNTLIFCIWKKKELSKEWKESIIIIICKKSNAKNCSNYRGISLLPTAYRILSNILLSRLTPYAEQSIGDHQCGFRRNRLTNHIFCICQILEEEYNCNEAVHQLFADFKKAYDSVWTEAFYPTLIEFGMPMKLVRLIKMCLNETYKRVWVGKHLFDMFFIRNGLKPGDSLLPLLFNYAL